MRNWLLPCCYSIAGLLVPVPIMMLSVLTGVVQAYIFAVLTVVYLSAAVRAPEELRSTSCGFSIPLSRSSSWS